jgi:putative ABC transport system permease protein
VPFYEAVRLALQTIRAQKLKSFFSVIGVFIGVTFLIAAVSIVNGMNRYMTEKFAGSLVGVNTFHLRNRPNINFNVTDSLWRAWRRRPRVTFADADAVSKGLTVPALTSWFSEDQGTVEYGGKVAKSIDLQGTGADYFAIKNYNFAEGRPFSPQEAKAGIAVAVLGWDLAQKLFISVDPIGKTVRIQGLPYTVIGVIEQQGSLLGMSLDKFVIAPATSPIQRDVNPPHVVDAVMVKTATIPDMNAAMDQVEGIMRSRHHLRPTQDDNFTLETAEGVLDFWNGISKLMFYFGPGIVMISLVVGGIVIMNIMLMAVAERTREIGVRKSLGARRQDILRQFLAEAVTLSTVGAGVGIGTGILLSLLINAITPLPASVAPWSVGVGVLLGSVVGVLFGTLPAIRASKLDPIAALRQE